MQVVESWVIQLSHVTNKKESGDKSTHHSLERHEDPKPVAQQGQKWQIIEFSKRRNLLKRNSGKIQSEETGISVKLFHADTDKYFDFKLLNIVKARTRLDLDRRYTLSLRCANFDSHWSIIDVSNDLHGERGEGCYR